MAKRLLKRTAPDAPKPMAQRGKEEEPETSVEKGAENVATTSTGKMGKCVSCRKLDAHSETDHLCYNCHKEANGFEFDGSRWAKKIKKEKKK